MILIKLCLPVLAKETQYIRIYTSPIELSHKFIYSERPQVVVEIEHLCQYFLLNCSGPGTRNSLGGPLIARWELWFHNSRGATGCRPLMYNIVKSHVSSTIYFQQNVH